jgi:hypothetical protein
MKDQHVHLVENGLPKSSITPQIHLNGKWSRSVTVVVVAICVSLAMIPPGASMADDQAAGTNSSDDTGIQVASWLLTIPYCAGKSAFAVAGSVVGGLGYAFSGGNSKTAESVWKTSVYGTYILRPAHLRGEEPIHFLGQTDAGHNEVASHPVRHASEAPEPPRE